MLLKKRNIILNSLNPGQVEKAHLDRCENFRVGTFMAALDVLSSDIDYTTKAYSGVCDRFGFLRNLTEIELIEPREMRHVA